MNQYTIFNADNPTDKYKVVIDRTGEKREHLKATVSKMRNKRKVTIGSAEQDVEQGKSSTVKPRAKMLQDLEIRNNGKCKLFFLYGNPGTLPWSVYPWETTWKGWNWVFSAAFPDNLKPPDTPKSKPKPKEAWSHGRESERTRKPDFKDPGAYCETGPLQSTDRRPGGAGSSTEGGTRTTCWFPGG